MRLSSNVKRLREDSFMENEEPEVFNEDRVDNQDEPERNVELIIQEEPEFVVQDEDSPEDNKGRWIVTIIAFVIVVITFLFKPVNGKKKWMIPIIAIVIVVITFIQLAFVFRRAESGRMQNNVVSVEMDWDYVEEEYNSLSFLSRNLQEMTIALNYEMMREVMEDDFDFIHDIAHVHLQDYGDFYFNGEWSYDIIDNLDDGVVHDTIYQLLSNRLSYIRGQLSTLSSSYGIAYLAIHEDGAMISSGNDFYELINGEIDFELIEMLEDQFAHVVVVQYNQNGRWEVPLLVADETFHIIHDYLQRHDGVIDGVALTGRIPGMTSLTYQFNMSEDEYLFDHVLEWQNPRNMTFVYGIPYDTFEQLATPLELPQTGGFGFNYYTEDEYYWNNWWSVWSYASSARTTAVWIMVGIVFIIPLAKVKEFDRGYEKIRKLPIDLLAFGTFVAWMFVHSSLNNIANQITGSRGLLSSMIFSPQNIRVVNFHVLLFISLCLLGYLVHYIKDLFASQWETLRHDSLIYKLYIEFIAVDLKKSQSLRIFILVFGQILVGFVIFLLASSVWNYEMLVLIVLSVGYLFLVFMYARYKAAKVRRDYMRLFEITQELAAGNLEVSTPQYLGYFDSLKNELVTIQHGLGHAVERALSSERMKGDLITNVSHDLKTPLTSIITYVDLLQVEGLSEEKRSQYLKTLELKTERLKMLIEDLFEVSKASSGNLQLDLREVDVVTLMRQTVLGLEDRIMEAGLTLRETYPEESIKMELDGGRMHRVFENLIINMVKYAMPNTRAYIDIVNFGGIVKITLRNISAREINVDLSDLSERFVRGEQSRTTEGSGLGLAIAKSFIELQGGTFEITVDGDLFKVIMTF